MLSRINRWLRSKEMGGDSGLALVLVIGISSVLAILVVSAIAVAVSGVKSASKTDDWSAALAAAYAGIEEYQSRLAADPSYLQYGNAAAAYSAGSNFTNEPVGKTNPAFKLGTNPNDWAIVAGSNTASPAKFRYEINNSKYSSEGTIKIRSSGLVGKTVRTIVADLKQQGFIDFLYFTDYEVQDPSLTGTTGSTCYKPDGKMKRADEGRPQTAPNLQNFTDSNACANVAFGASDIIDGPMHSNDEIRACSSVFKDTVTTSSTLIRNGKRYFEATSNAGACGSSPNFELDGYPKYNPPLGMPPTNTELKKEVRSDLTSTVLTPGCLYTGPTTITFNVDGTGSPNGTMTVRSPWTKATQITGEPASGGSTPAMCGPIGNVSNGLGSSGGATINVPENRVIFIQSVPTATGNPNRWGTSTPANYSCAAADSTKGNPIAGNGVGYPAANEWVPAGTTPYSCTYGDVFVKGEVDSKTTIASDNNIFVVGDITYKDDQEDVLGIIAQNAVFVWNPVKRTDTNDSILAPNREINAAILSVEHTFQVQNFNRGENMGTLTVNGAIAQKYRGTVRQSSGSDVNGYAKSYHYDPRFKFTAPPKFLSPVTTTYGVTRYIEVDAAFRSNGAQ